MKKGRDATDILFLCHSTATNAESSTHANFYSLRHFPHLLLTVFDQVVKPHTAKGEITQIYYKSYYKENPE